MLNKRRAHWAAALALVLIVPAVHAELIITTNTTQNGATFVVSPADTLAISHPTNNPLLTLTNGATTSGISYVFVGAGTNGKGRLLVQQGSIFSNSGSSYLGNLSGSTGTATVTGAGSQWQNSEFLYVGHSGTGTLNIQDGGLVTSSYGGYLGGLSGSTGTATVTGSGSKWQNYGSLSLGISGTGTLSIQNGGVVTSTYGNLGDDSSSHGTATITGTGSKWQNSGSLTIGGGTGTGTLNVENGGLVTSYDSFLGDISDSNGTATITGTGSQWQNSGDLTVGSSGAGTLSIQNGGVVTYNVSAYLGYSSGSTGKATVTGPGSQLMGNNASQWGKLYVGYSGNGSLTIENGGLVTHNDNFLGYNSDSTGTVTVTGAGSKWEGGMVNAGVYGTGTLTIENGGLVTSNFAYLGSAGTGTATVTGSGSEWKNSHNMVVGYSGAGTMNIENGGLVSGNDNYLDDDFLGFNSGSTGTVIVTDTGSQWKNTHGLYVGYNGAGTLTVKNRGIVITKEYASLGLESGSNGAATVTGTGSQWLIGSSFSVGNSGTGTLNINNGGLVSSTSGKIGVASGSNGSVTVNGNGSKWQNSGDLFVGYNGTGKLQVMNNGVVEVDGSLVVGTLGTLLGPTSTPGLKGTIVGDVVNHGLIDPGVYVGGVLTIDGDLTNSGIVAFELGMHPISLRPINNELVVSGEVDLGGVIEIDLWNGFHPQLGNSFKLLDFDSFMDNGYTFDFTHALLAEGLAWDISTFEVDGTISVRVVPETGSLVLAGIVSLAGLAVWRKRGESDPRTHRVFTDK